MNALYIDFKGAESCEDCELRKQKFCSKYRTHIWAAHRQCFDDESKKYQETMRIDEMQTRLEEVR